MSEAGAMADFQELERRLPHETKGPMSVGANPSSGIPAYNRLGFFPGIWLKKPCQFSFHRQD
jgi:hypothetical protein